MIKSKNIRYLMYIFITATLVLIFMAIALWEETPISIKLTAAGAFSLVDAIAFAFLMINQEQYEKTQDVIKPAPAHIELEQKSFQEIASLPDLSKIYLETRYYCPRCQEEITEKDVWGGANNGTYKLHKKCNSQTVSYRVPTKNSPSFVLENTSHEEAKQE